VAKHVTKKRVFATIFEFSGNIPTKNCRQFSSSFNLREGAIDLLFPGNNAAGDQRRPMDLLA